VPVDPNAERLGTWMGAVRCRERKGGLQKCYENALMTNEARKVFRKLPAGSRIIAAGRRCFAPEGVQYRRCLCGMYIRVRHQSERELPAQGRQFPRRDYRPHAEFFRVHQEPQRSERARRNRSGSGPRRADGQSGVPAQRPNVDCGYNDRRLGSLSFGVITFGRVLG
jgi:hypothetical protein